MTTKKATVKSERHDAAETAAPAAPESPAESTKAVLESLIAVLEAQSTIPKETAAHLKGQL